MIEAGTPLAELGAALMRRHGGVIGCIAYGSCLRTGDIFNGLTDVYLVVEDYASAHASRFAAAFNALLPPNVYYAEVPVTGGLARVKYAVLSLPDLERGCAKWFESYVWGRFAQPVGLIGLEAVAQGERVRAALANAAHRLIVETLPLADDQFTSRELVTTGLARSYATELRAEKPDRIVEIIDYAREHYRLLCASCLEGNRSVRRIEDDLWQAESDGLATMACRGKWRLRGVLGKLKSLMRLFKAYFTFRDGIDYLVWKLARHSGQSIEVPDRVRRFPLVFGWSFFLHLYRQGVFK